MNLQLASVLQCCLVLVLSFASSTATPVITEEELKALGDSDQVPSASDSPSESRLFRGSDAEGSIFSRCRAWQKNACPDDLECIRNGIKGQCLPADDNNCLVEAVNNFTQNFDMEQWKEASLRQAGLTESSLSEATEEGFNGFQDTPEFSLLIEALQTNIPTTELLNLQQSVNKCGYVDGKASSSGTSVYMGLHLELSALIDLAMSVFWIVGENADACPRGFIRGIFGAQLGLGVEATGLLGFAFTGTTSDIEGGGIATDVGGGVGPVNAGTAVVANFGGPTSLEFTLGPGAGVGIGLGYSITSALDEEDCTAAPTASPTMSPTKGPTGSPTESPTTSPSMSPTGSPTSPTGSPTESPTTSPTTASPTQSPTASPTDSPTASPTGTPPEWAIGTSGASCDTTCTSLGFDGCNSASHEAIDTATELDSVAASVGVTCSTTQEDASAIAAPVLPAEKDGDCFFNTDTTTASCTATATGVRRFCCCSNNGDSCPVPT